MNLTPSEHSEKMDSAQRESCRILQMPYGLLQSNTYLIILDHAACLIDPAMPTGRLPDGLPPIRWLIATHGHWDHVAEADNWRNLTGAPLLIHPSDATGLINARINLSAQLGCPGIVTPAEQLLADNQVIMLDTAHQLKVLHTPGHTSGSICLLLEEKLSDGTKKACALFTGDTLFAGSVGRTDLGGSAIQLRQSLSRLAGLSMAGCEDKKAGQCAGHDESTAAEQKKDDSANRIPDKVPVYPGHGPASTYGQERRSNPYLQI